MIQWRFQRTPRGIWERGWVGGLLPLEAKIRGYSWFYRFWQKGVLESRRKSKLQVDSVLEMKKFFLRMSDSFSFTFLNRRII